MDSLLSGKVQQVRTGREKSRRSRVLCNILQGSKHVLPILFTTYINDLPLLARYLLMMPNYTIMHKIAASSKMILFNYRIYQTVIFQQVILFKMYINALMWVKKKCLDISI